MEIWKYICVFLFFLKQIHGLRFQSVDGALPQDTQEFSIECSGESGSGVDFFKETSNLGTCLPTPFCSVNAGYDYSIDGSNYTFKITTVSSSSCGAYKCKDIGNLQEDIYELTYNKFSSANTTLSPLEPTAGESGALNITTACLFPASDESLTIKWYKTYQDGKADEALDSSFEIYNETQRSTCTETCSTDTDAKMLIGCRYTPPSNRGTGFQIKVEVMHKAYTDKLYWTFDGTYYDEVPSTTTSTTSTTNMLPDTNTTHPTSKRPVTDHGLPDWAIGVIAGGAFLAIVIGITIVAKKQNLCCFKTKDFEENQTEGNEQSENNIEQSVGINMKTKV